MCFIFLTSTFFLLDHVYSLFPQGAFSMYRYTVKSQACKYDSKGGLKHCLMCTYDNYINPVDCSDYELYALKAVMLLHLFKILSICGKF